MKPENRTNDNRKIVIAATAIVVLALAVVSVNSFLGGSLDPKDSRVFVVVTDSMDGEETDWPVSKIPVDSLVVVKVLDRDELSDVSVGDVLAYEWGGLTVVHRVTENDPYAETFTTKGDANDYSDTVPYDKAFGKVIGVYPTLGKLTLAMKSNVALTIAGVIALVIAASTVVEIYRIVTNKEEK